MATELHDLSITELAGLERLAALPGYEEVTPDLVEAVLEEAAKLAGNELAPLNQPADRAGSVLENGVVRTPGGFREAYARYVEGGWNGLAPRARSRETSGCARAAASSTLLWASPLPPRLRHP